MEKTKIILDTDIGDDIDDAFALSLILETPSLDLLGVVTTFRNAGMRAQIASRMLALHGRNDIPVYAGEDDPVEGGYKIQPYEHLGPDGKVVICHCLEEMRGLPVRGGGVDFILETARKYPHEVTLCAIGPLTDLARAIERDPEGFALLKELRIMGGSLFDGLAEWNFACDAYAAAKVFAANVPVTLYPLDVTRLCRIAGEDTEYFLGLRGSEKGVLAQMLSVWLSNNPGKQPCLHDALVIACFEHDYCNYIPVSVSVDTEGAKGFTRVSGDLSAKPNVRAAYLVDGAAFIRFMREKLADREGITA